MIVAAAASSGIDLSGIAGIFAAVAGALAAIVIAFATVSNSIIATKTMKKQDELAEQQAQAAAAAERAADAVATKAAATAAANKKAADEVVATAAATAAQAKKASDDAAALLADATGKTDAKLEELAQGQKVIHTLVNSNLTEFMQGKLDSLRRELVWMMAVSNPSPAALGNIADTQRQILELQTQLNERAVAAAQIAKLPNP